MDLELFGGAATIALASTFLLVLIASSWQALSNVVTGRTRFPDSIMREAAQRFRDDLEKLSRQQTMFLGAALSFVVIFIAAGLLRPQEIVGGLSTWQLALLLLVLIVVAAYGCYRLAVVTRQQYRLRFVRDACIAIGHGLQKLTSGQNRVFHDVPCGGAILDNVVVGSQGVYVVHVVARRPGKDNRVRLNGDKLQFASRNFTLPLEEFSRRSQSFARECRKLLNQEITVRSVIAVPGWEVEAQSSDAFLVVNERHLSMLGGWKNPQEYLLDEDVDEIQAMLTHRCTRFNAA